MSDATLDRPLLNAGDDVFVLEEGNGLSPSTTATDDRKGDEVLPYSCGNEFRFFFGKGVPMGLSAVMEWGAPPFIAMVFAGHQLLASRG